MGTWGDGIFENDAARDWLAGVEEGDVVAYVHKTLLSGRDAKPPTRSVIFRIFGTPKITTSIGIHQAQDLLAAIGLVVCWSGGHVDGFPPEMSEWLGRHKKEFQREWIQLGLEVLKRVECESDLAREYSEVPLEWRKLKLELQKCALKES